jgi:hypothetical protein
MTDPGRRMIRNEISNTKHRIFAPFQKELYHK